MSTVRDLYQLSQNFKKHLLNYLLVFLSLDLLIEILIIPLFRLLTTYILQAGAIPFVSYQNLVTIITTHTAIFLALIVELLVLISIIYLLFAFLMISIRAISLDNFTLKAALHQTGLVFKRMRASSLILVFCYFVLIVPFTDVVFRTSLLAKIQIPEFILDYMTRSPFLIVILVLFYVVVSVLGLRLVYTLPIMVLANQKAWPAMKTSWYKTSNWAWLALIKKFVCLFVITVLISFAFYSSLYFMQLVWDLFPGEYSYFLALINLTLVQVISLLVLIWSSVSGFLVLFEGLNLTNEFSMTKDRCYRFLPLLLMIALIVVALPTNAGYLQGGKTRPIIISHRGVSDKNGVQNTIPALKKTAKLKPDYVEIDLHETKDRQFVLMHDENLKQLTGVNKMPHELTLKQLTRLTAKEDGHQAKIVSFDQYLKEAQKLHQKLLIEIKTTPADSKKMLERFNKKYAKTIIKNHDQVQSLDYRVVEGLKEINPRLKVLYIQPYNFTYPKSSSDGYSMEYSTLNSDFIWQAHLKHHSVYAWTVNDASLMKQLMYDHVDGIITDDIPEVKEAINDFRDNSSYAKRLLNYIVVLSNNSIL